jgi:predicted TPR repeat methyltransferase
MPQHSPADDHFEQAKAAFVAGLTCQQAGAFAPAEAHYRKSLSLLPGRASTLINLAATLLQLARPQDALASADAALAAEPDSTDALLHRATALAQLDRPHDALAAFERLLTLAPEHAPAWSMRGSLLRELQRFDEAAQAFRQALHHGADPALNAYYLAAVEARDAPPASPPAYVQGLFDRYADEFDQHLLEQLHYQGHRHLIDGLLAVSGGPYESALDLGCGTGLCGALVRAHVGRLTGVDLSARMLDKARELGVYDRLEQADVVEFLCRIDQRQELLLAADVFIYIGDLRPLFEAARRAMDRGVFCFSVEAIERGDADFQLQPSLRYAHSKPYLLRMAAQHGFELIAMRSAPVREDQREAVDGLYVYLKRA